MTNITINAPGDVRLNSHWHGSGPQGVALQVSPTDEVLIWFDGEDARDRAQRFADMFIERGLTTLGYDVVSAEDGNTMGDEE